MTRLLMIALTLGLAACGQRPDTSTRCEPSTCEGCCQGEVCQPGLANDACGGGGGVCTSCVGPQVCSGARKCEPPVQADAGSGEPGGPDGGSAATPDPEWTRWKVPPDAPPASGYQLSGGVVSDTVTGLKWQQVLSTKTYTRAGALAYCSGLSLGGLSWRLPTLAELVTIVGIGRLNPAIDQAVFPATPGKLFWSSSLSTDLPGHGWVVDFLDGATSGKDQTLEQYVRCVGCAGAQCAVAAGAPGAPQGRYVVSAETVFDTVTGLTWQRAPIARTVTWGTNGCPTLPGTGWRRPTVKELQSLVDVRASGAAIDGAAFPNTPSHFVWTSARGTSPQSVWTVDFSFGTTLTKGATASGQERCVR